MVMMVVVVLETRLDDVRWRPDLTRGCPRVGARRRLGRDDLWREGLVVGDPVAVPELPVLPLGQRAAVAELGAARREGGAAVAPLDPLRPAMVAMFAMFAEIIWTHRQVTTRTTSNKKHEAAILILTIYYRKRSKIRSRNNPDISVFLT